MLHLETGSTYQGKRTRSNKMKKLLLLLCIFLTACPQKPAHLPDNNFMLANPRIMGDDHLALLSRYYDAKGAAKSHHPVDAIGILDTTFGSGLSHLHDFLYNSHVSWVRIHILNTVCIRNRNCGKYEPGYGYSVSSFDAAVRAHNPKLLNHVRNRVAVYRDFFVTYAPNNPVAVSPALEHNLSKESYRILADTVLSTWTVQLVNNPMSGSGEAYKGSWIEGHGKNSGKNITSTDGAEVMDIDTTRYVKVTANNILTFRWSRRNNCRAQGSFVDPRSRKSCLTGREAEQQVHVTDTLAKAPTKTFSCSTRSISVKDIYKVLSEDHGTGDRRANLPVLIPSGFNTNTVSLVTSGGKSVGTLGYYGKYTDGRPRFYSGWSGGSKLTGYEFQKRAGGYVWAKQGSRCIGPFIPGRRQGEFR